MSSGTAGRERSTPSPVGQKVLYLAVHAQKRVRPSPPIREGQASACDE